MTCLRLRTIVLTGLALIVFAAISFDHCQAQRRGGRSGLQAKQRIEGNLQKRLDSAIKALKAEPDKFAADYIDSTQFNSSFKSLSESEAKRLAEVLTLFQNQPIEPRDDSPQSASTVEIVIEISPERAAQLAPPKPEVDAAKPNAATATAGYGDEWKPAVQAAITDLKAERIEQFVSKFYPLSEIERFKQADLWDRYLVRLSEDEPGRKLLLADLQQMVDQKPQATTQQDRSYLVFALKTTADQFTLRPHKYQLERRFPVPQRASILELSDGDWRLYDGNRDAMNPAAGASLRVRAGQISLEWTQTDTGWKLTAIPYFR